MKRRRKPSTFRTSRGSYPQMAAQLRRLRGKLQQKLVAKAAGLSTVAASSYETGRTLPSAEALRCLCVAMGCEGALQELLSLRAAELQTAIERGGRRYDSSSGRKPGRAHAEPRPAPRLADPTPAPRRRGPGFSSAEAARRAGVLGGLAAASKSIARTCRTCGEPRKGHPAAGCPKAGTAKPLRTTPAAAPPSPARVLTPAEKRAAIQAAAERRAAQRGAA